LHVLCNFWIPLVSRSGVYFFRFLDSSKDFWSIVKGPWVEGKELGEGKRAFSYLDLKNSPEAHFPSRGVHYLEDKIVLYNHLFNVELYCYMYVL
jgi:hypothetical protein